MNKPWTETEMDIIRETLSMPTREVAEMLPDRSFGAVQTKRSYMRHGRAIERTKHSVVFERVKPMTLEEKRALFAGRRYVDAGIRA